MNDKNQQIQSRASWNDNKTDLGENQLWRDLFYKLSIFLLEMLFFYFCWPLQELCNLNILEIYSEFITLT